MRLVQSLGGWLGRPRLQHAPIPRVADGAAKPGSKNRPKSRARADESSDSKNARMNPAISRLACEMGLFSPHAFSVLASNLRTQGVARKAGSPWAHQHCTVGAKCHIRVTAFALKV